MVPVLRRSSYVIAGLILSLALVTGVAGCDGQYESAVRSIFHELRLVEEQSQKTLAQSQEKMSEDSAGHVASTQAAEQEWAKRVTAIAKAQADLQALQPPDEESQAIHADLLEYLDDYSVTAQQVSAYLAYAESTILITERMRPLFEWGGLFVDTGALSELIDTDVAAARDRVQEVEDLMSDCTLQWRAVSPPAQLADAHESLGESIRSTAEGLWYNVRFLTEMVASPGKDGADANFWVQFLPSHMYYFLKDVDVWAMQCGTWMNDVKSRLDAFEEREEELKQALEAL